MLLASTFFIQFFPVTNLVTKDSTLMPPPPHFVTFVKVGYFGLKWVLPPLGCLGVEKFHQDVLQLEQKIII